MHTIQINDYKTEFAEKWDELTKKELLTLMSFFQKKSPESEIKFKVLLLMLNLQVMNSPAIKKGEETIFKIKPKHFKPFWVTAEQMASLLSYLNFLTKIIKKEKEEIRILESKLTKQVMPTFKLYFKKYYGPGDRLFNIIFDEFLEADNHFLKFLQTQDDKELDKLVATLYRKRDRKTKKTNQEFSGDVRQPFNDNLITRNSKKLHKLPREKKLLIFFFYQGCRNFLTINFPAVFSQNGEKSTGRNYGPLSLIDALSGDDVTKNKLIKQTPLYDVLVRLQKAAETAELTKQNL